MCAIFGVLTTDLGRAHGGTTAYTFGEIIAKSVERGRDGMGVAFQLNRDATRPFKTVAKHQVNPETSQMMADMYNFSVGYPCRAAIGNTRAEPTTEWVKVKSEEDQQPYTVGYWTIVHNGTIANDKELRHDPILQTKIDSAAIVELLDDNSQYYGLSLSDAYNCFHGCITALKGSYAILAMHSLHPGHVFTACNYRPIWTMQANSGIYFASTRGMFPEIPRAAYEAQEQYTTALWGTSGESQCVKLYQKSLLEETGKRALVVCSGGLDSVVSATIAKKEMGMDITLIHFTYGCRAEEKEIHAVEAVAAELGVKLVLYPMHVYDKEDSPLLNDDSTVAGGEEGAEFAHEWVPARNLVMLSIATAYAEAKGFDYIVLGNNLEEAGAYPDNEPEFINRFNALLPFAVGDGKRVRVIMPVGNLMKHEIVARGLALAAPMHSTWSCYRNGHLHCGTCGPCFMRKTAFKINGAKEVIQYEQQDEGSL